jgi:integrase
MASIRKRTWTTKAGEQTVWLVDYRDGAGARRFRQFSTKREARAFLPRAQVDVAEGKHVADSQSATVAQAAEMWLTVCRDGAPDGDPGPLEPSTWREYERHVGYLTDPDAGLGRIKLTQLTKPHVDAFLTRLREKGRSAATARKVRGSLATLLAFAQDRKLVARNVLREGTRRKRSAREAKEIVSPSKAELVAMLDQAAPLWFRAFVTTAIYTGLRASELRGLPWGNVDLEAGVVRVRQRADFAGRIGPPKSKAGNRDVPMTPTVRKLLAELHLAQGRPEDGLVFKTAAGTAIHHSNLVQRFYNPMQVRLEIADPKLDQAGKPVVDEDGEPVMVARYGLHALRHAAASLFIEQGWTPKKVQTVMGHSSIAVTYDVYGHLFRSGDDDQAAMVALEASLNGTRNGL